MTISQGTITYLDGAAATKTAPALLDSTIAANVTPAHALVNASNVIVNPATSDAQTSAQTSLSAIATSVASTASNGAVQTGAVHLVAAPAVTAGAYTNGQVVGGLISLSGAARANAGSGLIETVNVNVKTALTAPFDVLFFDTNPTNSTFTDNAALAVNTADLPFLCGVAHCSDLISMGTPQLLQAANIAMPFKLSASATILYAVIVLRGAQTFASTSAIGLSVSILQN